MERIIRMLWTDDVNFMFVLFIPWERIFIIYIFINPRSTLCILFIIEDLPYLLLLIAHSHTVIVLLWFTSKNFSKYQSILFCTTTLNTRPSQSPLEIGKTITALPHSHSTSHYSSSTSYSCCCPDPLPISKAINTNILIIVSRNQTAAASCALGEDDGRGSCEHTKRSLIVCITIHFRLPPPPPSVLSAPSLPV